MSHKVCTIHALIGLYLQTKYTELSLRQELLAIRECILNGVTEAGLWSDCLPDIVFSPPEYLYLHL